MGPQREDDQKFAFPLAVDINDTPVTPDLPGVADPNCTRGFRATAEPNSLAGANHRAAASAAATVVDEGHLELRVETLKTGGWRTTPFIFGTEAGERLAMSGSHANLITFLVDVMHQKTLMSATTLNTFNSVAGWTPLLGAFVADAYLGRYLTIALASVIYLSGLVLLTISAIQPHLKPPPCSNEERNAGVCEAASSFQMAVIYVSLSLMVVGSGGIRPCVSPFGASQFDLTNPKESKQLKHYFNWFYFSMTVASLLAATIIVYIQDNISWSWGFGLTAIVMLGSLLLFLSGTSLYRYGSPRGSPFTRMAQVIVAAIRKRKLVIPDDPSLLHCGLMDQESEVHTMGVLLELREMDAYGGGGGDGAGVGRPLKKLPGDIPHSRQFRFLDRAAIEVQTDFELVRGCNGEIVSRRVRPWRLCTVHHVEDLKSLVRLIPMWTTSVIVGIAIAQQFTYTIQQARTMDRRIGSIVVPPASMHCISTITVLIWLPFYDRYLVPKVLRPWTGHPTGITFLQKLGIAHLLHIFNQAIVTIVEHKRRMAARHYGLVDKPYDVIPISAFWLVPQYVVGGLAESFGMVGHIEFFYHMVPEHITSTASALGLTPYALGSLFNSALLNLLQNITDHGPSHPGWLDNNLNKAHLDYFFALLTALVALNFVLFLFVAKWYMKQELRR